MIVSNNSRVMPPAATVGTASPLCFSPPGRKADRSSSAPHSKMASSPQVLPRPPDVMQNLSTFVQAAASPEQPRGCKHMVTQHLSHHVQQLCAISGGTHLNSKHSSQTCLKNFFTTATARASAFSTKGGSTPTQIPNAVVRTPVGTQTSLMNTSLRTLSECLSSSRKHLLSTQCTTTAQPLDVVTALKNTGSVPSLQPQKQEQQQTQQQMQQFHHQHVQQRQQENRVTQQQQQQQQRHGTQQHQHSIQQPQHSLQNKSQPPLQPQPDRRRESLDRELPAVKSAGGPQACMRGAIQGQDKDAAKPKVLAASPAAGSTSSVTQKNGSTILQSPDAGEKKCVDAAKLEKDDVCGGTLLPFGSFSSIPGVPTAPENTLVILDYDDTLLPTNWAAVQNRVALTDPVPAELLPPLAELSDTAIQTIDVCLNTAMVVIVTNASMEWVNRSGEKFIPTVLGHIEKQGIQVISARDRLQNTGLPQKQWKIKVFEELINDVFGERMRDGSECSIVSIGDGEGEREACLEMCRNLGINEWLFKSLKLLSQPTCQQLSSQHVLIQQAFLDILKVRQSLDMAILDYKNNVGGHPEDLPCVDDFPCGSNGSPAAAAANKDVGCLRHFQNFETPPAEAAAAAAEHQRRNGATALNSLHKAPHDGFQNEFLFEGVPTDDNLKSQCRVHCPAAVHRKSGYANYDVATFPENTDAFVDLISDQLKAEQQPSAAVSRSSPGTARSGPLCAEEGDGAFADHSRILIA